jgi:endonuclease YncB( thermonuclease family)
MTGSAWKLFIAVAASWALFGPAPARSAQGALEGKVTEVISGDTLLIADGGTRVEVRLADINAPQGSEYYAPAARTLLASMVLDQPVRVKVTGSGGPDRVFGRVTVGELDVNLEMVRQGAAWVCWDFAADTYFMPWENAARRWKRGLWGATWEITARAACLRRPPVEQAAPK